MTRWGATARGRPFASPRNQTFAGPFSHFLNETPVSLRQEWVAAAMATDALDQIEQARQRLRP